MNILLLLIALFICVESLYAAKHASDKNRLCDAVKYMLAFGTSVFLMLEARRTVDYIDLFYGFSVAAFVWPDSFYRIKTWVEIHSPKLYNLYFKKLSTERRGGVNWNE